MSNESSCLPNFSWDFQTDFTEIFITSMEDSTTKFNYLPRGPRFWTRLRLRIFPRPALKRREDLTRSTSSHAPTLRSTPTASFVFFSAWTESSTTRGNSGTRSIEWPIMHFLVSSFCCRRSLFSCHLRTISIYQSTSGWIFSCHEKCNFKHILEGFATVSYTHLTLPTKA